MPDIYARFDEIVAGSPLRAGDVLQYAVRVVPGDGWLDRAGALLDCWQDEWEEKLPDGLRFDERTTIKLSDLSVVHSVGRELVVMETA